MHVPTGANGSGKTLANMKKKVIVQSIEELSAIFKDFSENPVGHEKVFRKHKQNQKFEQKCR